MRDFTSMQRNPDILLLDDQTVVRAGIARLLAQAGGFVIAEAGNVEEARQIIQMRPPKVVVLGLAAPPSHGFETVRKLREFTQDVRILILSDSEDDVFARRAMKVGANGFASKRIAPEELIGALKLLMKGQNYLSTDIARRIANSAISDEVDPVEALSNREFEIFERLARGQSVAEIAADLNLSSKTVANHRLAVLKKLGVKNTVELAHISFRRGLPGSGE